MTDDEIEAGNKFLRDFVTIYNVMHPKTEQDTRRKKLEEIDRLWEAIQTVDTSGTVPR
tara:strand:- start:300 stop:473 length:174 start_codon:yes stop_codon:yes gene_type:complete